jgi:ATP-binding cassette subfamily F protein 3
VGLVGANGSGKSTLLKLMAGELTTESGFLTFSSGLRVGYLPQEPQLEEGTTLFQEVFAASTDLARIEAEMARVEMALADPAVYGDEKRLNRKLAQQAALLERFMAKGGPGYESRVRGVLLSLGFAPEDFDLPITALSGGQKKLAGLARLLVQRPHILLLDEPDNHLDMAGKAFLEQFIRNFKGGVVLVSHDRYLLDVVVDEIAEIEDGRLSRYAGTYSEFAYDKQMRLQRQAQMFRIQQREIGRLEQAAQRLLTWGRAHDNEKLIKQGKAILKRVDRIDRIEKPILERKKMGLELKGWRGSKKVLEIIDLDKVFGGGEEEKIVLAGLNLLLFHGDRAGLVGANGAGKSVLFRLILGQEAPSGGTIKLGPSVSMGYYAQEHETLDYAQTPLDAVRHAAAMSESAAMSFLGKFLFSYNQARGRIGNLSGGERSRLQMALLMLSGANFLLLDEPTNNLDIASAEVLEAALAEFEGAVLVISHDRYFLDRVATRIILLSDGTTTDFAGNYSDYLAASG